MDKGLEAFENIRTQIRYPKCKRPERSKEELLSDLNIVEKELKALEIIKRILKDKKGGDYLHYLVNYIREYPEDKLCYFVGFMGDEYPILVNDKDYELLREVLK